MATAVQQLDEAQTRALDSDIHAQLSQLPTVIPDVATCQRAKESLVVLKRAEDSVVAFFRPMKDAAHKAHKAITSRETASLNPIKDARAKLSNLIWMFDAEQDRIRRAAEREAADLERKRRDAEALAQAEELAAQGAPEMADQVLEHAIASPPPVVSLPSTATRVEGVSTVANWQWRFAGSIAGVKWENLDHEQRAKILVQMPREYLRADETTITAVVKALKGATKIPGIEVFDAGTIRVRG